MNFKEKYISDKENSLKEDLSRIVVSNEAYAIMDVINELINKIEHVRSGL